MSTKHTVVSPVVPLVLHIAQKVKGITIYGRYHTEIHKVRVKLSAHRDICFDQETANGRLGLQAVCGRVCPNPAARSQNHMCSLTLVQLFGSPLCSIDAVPL